MIGVLMCERNHFGGSVRRATGNKYDKLLFLVAFLIPFQLFGIPINNVGIEPAMVIVILFTIIFTLESLYKSQSFLVSDKIEKSLLLFALFSFFSLLLSSFNADFHGRAFLEYLRLLFMILFFLCMRSYVQKKQIFIVLFKGLYYGMFIISIFGVWQFISLNWLGIKFLADWSWATNLNPSISGWGMAGDRITYYGGIARIASFAHEPSYLALFLLGVFGFSFIVLKKGIEFPTNKKSANLFIAITIVLSLFLSLSAIGILGIILSLIVYTCIDQNRNILLSLLRLASIMAVAIFTLMLTGFGSALMDKVFSLYYVFFHSYTEDTISYFSTLVSFSHFAITKEIISNHPLLGIGIGKYAIGHAEYGDIVFGAFLMPATIESLNVESAGSLSLRLIAENGTIGALLFLYFLITIFKRAIKFLAHNEINFSKYHYYIFIGLIISSSGYIFGILSRMGNYHLVEFWYLLALLSAMPSFRISEKMP